jgi:hypothetical protein
MATSMEVLSLFPRYLLKGELPPEQLAGLQALARTVQADPALAPDASIKLAGQLALQRELGPQYPEVVTLCSEVLLPACERWIRHVIDQQPPEAHGPWARGRYQLQMIDIWLNVQRAGDYNPTHTHGGTFSGVVFLEVPPQITAERFDGQLCFYGPEDWHIQSFRTGMAHYVVPAPGDFYVFPAWQPHSVAPFRGEGDRLSLAFNVVAVPPQATPSTPAPAGNVSLSTSRRKPGGFR